MRRYVFLTLLLATACFGPAAAQDMRRCLLADGTVVHTDGQCADGQTEQPDTVPGNVQTTPGRAGIAPPPGCSANAGELLFNVRVAVDSRDVNMLARSYHWPGLGDAQVESVLVRLEALVQRPLTDIRLLFPFDAGTGYAADSSADAVDAGHPSAPQMPIGLKLLQYASPTDNTLTATRFTLWRHFGCWWIRY